MSNPYCLVAIKFEEEGRGGMDIENAFDAFSTPAQIDDISELMRSAEGVLQQYYDKHKNATALSIAEQLREYLKREDDDE